MTDTITRALGAFTLLRARKPKVRQDLAGVRPRELNEMRRGLEAGWRAGEPGLPPRDKALAELEQWEALQRPPAPEPIPDDALPPLREVLAGYATQAATADRSPIATWLAAIAPDLARAKAAVAELPALHGEVDPRLAALGRDLAIVAAPELEARIANDKVKRAVGLARHYRREAMTLLMDLDAASKRIAAIEATSAEELDASRAHPDQARRRLAVISTAPAEIRRLTAAAEAQARIIRSAGGIRLAPAPIITAAALQAEPVQEYAESSTARRRG
jgi:hypothetical protein